METLVASVEDVVEAVESTAEESVHSTEELAAGRRPRSSTAPAGVGFSIGNLTTDDDDDDDDDNDHNDKDDDRSTGKEHRVVKALDGKKEKVAKARMGGEGEVMKLDLASESSGKDTHAKRRERRASSLKSKAGETVFFFFLFFLLLHRLNV